MALNHEYNKQSYFLTNLAGPSYMHVCFVRSVISSVLATLNV
jgi:hypothetical protein